MSAVLEVLAVPIGQRIYKTHVTMLEDGDQQHAGNESAYVGAKRDPAPFRRRHERIDELHEEPKTKHPHGFDAYELGQESERDENENSCMRVQ